MPLTAKSIPNTDSVVYNHSKIKWKNQENDKFTRFLLYLKEIYSYKTVVNYLMIGWNIAKKVYTQYNKSLKYR